MRSPAMAMEAGEMMRRAPNSRPRSGPVPIGVTVASRSWIRSETSAIRAAFKPLREIQDHLQLLGVLKFPAAPREERWRKLFRDDGRDRPRLFRKRGIEGIHEAGAPALAPVGAGYDERGQGDLLRFRVPDQDIGVMVEVIGPRGSDRPGERLRGQHPRQAWLALSGRHACEVKGVEFRECVRRVRSCPSGSTMVTDEPAQRAETEPRVKVECRGIVLDDFEQNGMVPSGDGLPDRSLHDLFADSSPSHLWRDRHRRYAAGPAPARDEEYRDGSGSPAVHAACEGVQALGAKTTLVPLRVYVDGHHVAFEGPSKGVRGPCGGAFCQWRYGDAVYVHRGHSSILERFVGSALPTNRAVSSQVSA